MTVPETKEKEYGPWDQLSKSDLESVGLAKEAQKKCLDAKMSENKGNVINKAMKQTYASELGGFA